MEQVSLVFITLFIPVQPVCVTELNHPLKIHFHRSTFYGNPKKNEIRKLSTKGIKRLIKMTQTFMQSVKLLQDILLA